MTLMILPIILIYLSILIGLIFIENLMDPFMTIIIRGILLMISISLLMVYISLHIHGIIPFKGMM